MDTDIKIMTPRGRSVSDVSAVISMKKTEPRARNLSIVSDLLPHQGLKYDRSTSSTGSTYDHYFKSLESLEENSEQAKNTDRLNYEALLEQLKAERMIESLKNKFIHKRLVIYYKKLKMYHVIKDASTEMESTHRYEVMLDKLEASKEFYRLKLLETTEAEKKLEEMKENEREEATNMLTNLQTLEFNAVKEHLPHLDKASEKHLNRQLNLVEQLRKARLLYIKVRNKVTATQDALNAVDKIGSNLRLADYEQLKLDNRNFRDKLEQREVELINLRDKYQGFVQRLSHRTQKSNFIDMEMEKMSTFLDRYNKEYEDLRLELIDSKKRISHVRGQILKMKNNLGLLNYPRLLNQMENEFCQFQLLIDNIKKSRDEYEKGELLLIRLKKVLKSKEKIQLIRMSHRHHSVVSNFMLSLE